LEGWLGSELSRLWFPSLEDWFYVWVMSEWITLLEDADELELGGSRCFVVRGRRIAVFRVEEGYYAMDDMCTHADAPLSDGWIEDGCVVCPWHGARFDLKSGDVMVPPAVDAIRVYKVVVDGGCLRIELEG